MATSTYLVVVPVRDYQALYQGAIHSFFYQHSLFFQQHCCNLRAIISRLFLLCPTFSDRTPELKKTRVHFLSYFSPIVLPFFLHQHRFLYYNYLLAYLSYSHFVQILLSRLQRTPQVCSRGVKVARTISFLDTILLRMRQ